LAIAVWYLVRGTAQLFGTGDYDINSLIESRPFSEEWDRVLKMDREEYMAYRENDRKVRNEEKMERAEWRDWGHESSESEDEPLWIRKRKTKRVQPAIQ
jgi:hypothetical protein